MTKFIIAVFVLAFAFAVMALLGMLLAWLFAQFGIVKPWWVFSVAWFVLGLVAHVFRGGK